MSNNDTDPAVGWEDKAARSIAANRVNEVTNLLPALYYGVRGDDEARMAAAGRYQDDAAQAKALGPRIQSFDDAAG